MRESQGWLFEPTFNRSVKVRASDDRITSDGGLHLRREADHRLGITEWLAERLHDPRRQDLNLYQLIELLRERLYPLTLGYSAQDDADRLAHDPAMKLAAWNRPGEQPLDERMASQPTQSRLIDILTLTRGNLAALRDSLCESCERHLRATGGDHAARRVMVDIDSFPIQVHGRQPGAAYNGHYPDTVDHPLVASYAVAGDYDSMQEGYRLGNDFVHAILRQGAAHTAEGIKRFAGEVARKAKRVLPSASPPGGKIIGQQVELAGLRIGSIDDGRLGNRFANRRGLHRWPDVRLSDRGKGAIYRANQEQRGVRTTGGAASDAAGRPLQEGMRS